MLIIIEGIVIINVYDSNFIDNEYTSGGDKESTFTINTGRRKERMKDEKLNLLKENEDKAKECEELFEEVEDAVTASWTGCASCC